MSVDENYNLARNVTCSVYWFQTFPEHDSIFQNVVTAFLRYIQGLNAIPDSAFEPSGDLHKKLVRISGVASESYLLLSRRVGNCWLNRLHIAGTVEKGTQTSNLEECLEKIRAARSGEYVSLIPTERILRINADDLLQGLQKEQKRLLRKMREQELRAVKSKDNNRIARKLVNDLPPSQYCVFKALTKKYQSAPDIAKKSGVLEDQVRHHLPSLKRLGLAENKRGAGYRLR